MGGAEHAHIRALAVILPGGIDINAVRRQFYIRFCAIDAIQTAAVNADGNADAFFVFWR